MRKRGALSQDLVSCFASEVTQKSHKVYSLCKRERRNDSGGAGGRGRHHHAIEAYELVSSHHALRACEEGSNLVVQSSTLIQSMQLHKIRGGNIDVLKNREYTICVA